MTRLLLAWMLFCLPLVINAKTIITPYAQHWSTSRGLNDSLVYSIAEDRLQRIWLATPSGVSIIDGLGVTNLNNDKSLQDSLSSNVITRIVEHNQRMYILGLHGIDAVDPVTMQVEPVSDPAGLLNKANHITFTDQQYALVVAQSKLLRWDQTTQKVTPITTPNPEEDVIAAKHIDGNQYLIFTNTAFYDLNSQTMTFSKHRLNGVSPQEQDIRFYFTDSHQRLWLSVYGEGLYVYQEAQQLAHFTVENDHLASNLISNILEFEGRIFALTRRGVDVFNADTLEHNALLQPNSDNAAYMNSDMALTATMHSNGKLLVGTTNGFYVLPTQGSPVQHVSDLWQETPAVTLSITQDDRLLTKIDGDFWLLEDAQGEQLKRSRIEFSTSLSNPIASDENVFLYEDNKVAILEQGISLLTFDTAYNQEKLTGVFKTDQADIFFLTSKTHMFEVQRQGTLLKVMRTRPLNGVSITDLEVFDGYLYMVSRGAGLLTILMKQFNDVSLPLKKISGPKVPYDLYIDRQERLWVLTLEDGLYYQSLRQNPVTKLNYFEKANGQFNPICIAEDADGDLWFATQWSVSEWSANLKQKARYTSEDGVKPSTINRFNCGGVGNAVYFSSPNEIYWFNKKSSGDPVSDPAIQLTHVQDENRAYLASDNLEFVEPGVLKFSFYSTQLNLDPDYKFYYRVKEKGAALQEFENHWNLSTSKQIMLIRPSLGQFTLEAKLSVNDGFESNVSSVDFRIKEPFYTSTLMLLVYAAMVMVLIVLVFSRQLKLSKSLLRMTQNREQQQKRYSEQLSREVSEKTKQYKEQQQIAVKANIEKTRFIATASHDLRAPLHSMRLKLNNILPEEESDKRRVLAEFEHLDKLVESIVNLAKIDANIIKPSLSPFNLNELINDCCTRFEPLLAEKSITLQNDDGGKDWYVLSDRFLVSRLLLNLIDNAIKNIQSGGQIDITVACHDDEHVNLSVSDNGPGIPVHIRENVFGSFVRGTQHYAGTGLGLTIVKQIADMLDLQLLLRSSEEGTNFHFKMPLTTLNNSNGEQQPGIHHSKRALVIDDDPYYAHVASQLLQKLGFSVHLVDEINTTMWEGLRGDYRIVLCDYNLGQEVSGPEKIQSLLTSNQISSEQVVIMSEDKQARFLIKSYGRFQFLNKPLKRSKLSWLLQNYRKEG